MKRIKNILSWIAKQLGKGNVSSSNTSCLYKDLDIPFKIFLRALFKKDYTDIEDFSTIYSMYLEAIGGMEVERSISNVSRYEYLKNKIRLVEITLNLYRVNPTKELFDIIQGYDYMNGEQDFNAERADILIEQIVQQVSMDIVELKSIEAKHKASKENEKAESEPDYYNLLKSFEIEFKFYIPDTITMREFCSYFVNYKERLKQVKETE